METVTIDGTNLTLSSPEKSENKWVGSDQVFEQLLACWLTVDKTDLPLSPRIIGVPGIGKTTLAIAAARSRGQEVYVYQCTADTRPEDLLITPVLSEKGKLTYHASQLVTAMIKGGICILDEGNRMNEKSWASIAPLLDHRRSIESIIAGVKIKAHEDFRCCVTMNDDASTFEIPDYIVSRIQPTLMVTFPERKDEMEILKYNIPFAKEELLDITVDFLQTAHGLNLPFSTRDGINSIRYCMKRMEQNKDLKVEDIWQEGIQMVLGEEALNLEELAEKKNRFNVDQDIQQNLGDFFFGDDDDLNPDNDNDIF